MIKKILISLIALMVLQGVVFSQTSSVNVEFNINGKKSTKSRFKLWIYSGDKIIEVKGRKGKFIVPSQITSLDKIDIRLTVGKFDLSFSEITPKYFDNKWTVGIDSPPFESGEIPMRNGKRAILLYYIEYEPKKLEGIRESSIRYEP